VTSCVRLGLVPRNELPGTHGDGALPVAAVIIDSAENLYGTTSGGGAAGLGTVFKLDPSGHETVLYNFTGTHGDGALPVAAVIMDSAGNLYGTTAGGGAAGKGTVFKVDPSGNETVLISFSFNGVNGGGFSPVAGLIMDSAGNLYGTTEAGGSIAPPCSINGCRTVFTLDPSGNGRTRYIFGGTNGASPQAGLIMDTAGNLYGTTAEGNNSSPSCNYLGVYGCGTVFKLDPSGNQTVLYSFTGMNGDGADPVAGLIMDGAGNLYGTTAAGNNSSSSCQYLRVFGCGTVFKLDPSGNETVLYSFTGTNGDGAGPVAGLITDRAGNLYGTTAAGGSHNAGTVFRLAAPPDFSVAASSSSSATVTRGQTAKFTVSVAPQGGFDQTVQLSCGGAPAYSTCSLSSGSVTLNGSQPTSVTVTVTTAGTSASLTRPVALPPSGIRLALLLALSGWSGLVLLGRPRRRSGKGINKKLYLL
jgi:uncharacterized repeat protein (TIGR03803 family)